MLVGCFSGVLHLQVGILRAKIFGEMVCDWNNLAKSVLYLLLGVFARILGEVGDLVGP